MGVESVSDSKFITPTFDHALVIWWALLWRPMLLALPIGVVIGFVVALVGAIADVPRSAIGYLTMLAGVVVNIPVGVYVVQLVLRKRFREFSIRLVKND